MDSDKNIKVSCPRSPLRVLVFLNIFFIVLIAVYTFFSDGPHYKMYIAVAILIFLPSVFAGLWLALFSLSVDGEKITVRRFNGAKRSFFVSDILELERKIVHTDMVNTEKITIHTANGKYSVDSAMDNFEELSEFLLNNVSSDKIETKTGDMRKAR